MGHHLLIALGLLVGAIFAYRGANALVEPGLGLRELYVLGGLVIAALLIGRGLANMRARKTAQRDDPDA